MILTDSMYPEKKGGKRFTCTNDCIDASVKGIKFYIKKSEERLITEASDSIDKRPGRKTTKTRKQNWEEKCLEISSNKLTK